MSMPPATVTPAPTPGPEAWVRSLEVEGELAQVLRLEPRRGVDVWCEKGALISYTPGVQWELSLMGGAGKALGRMASGEDFGMLKVRATTDEDEVLIGANLPGKLATWELERGPITATRGAFVAGIGRVDVAVTVARSAGAALFGGGGLFMQRISGKGLVVLHGYGDFVVRELRHGEILRVSTGNLAAFSHTVSYSIVGVGGCRRTLFGGEGMFMTEMKGPGFVLLQTLKRAKAPSARGFNPLSFLPI